MASAVLRSSEHWAVLRVEGLNAYFACRRRAERVSRARGGLRARRWDGVSPPFAIDEGETSAWWASGLRQVDGFSRMWAVSTSRRAEGKVRGRGRRSRQRRARATSIRRSRPGSQ